MFEQKIVRIWSEADPDDGDYEVKSVEREVPLSDHLLVVLKEQKLAGLSVEWVFPVVTDREKTKGEKYVEFPRTPGTASSATRRSFDVLRPSKRR